MRALPIYKTLESSTASYSLSRDIKQGVKSLFKAPLANQCPAYIEGEIATTKYLIFLHHSNAKPTAVLIISFTALRAAVIASSTNSKLMP